MQTEEYAFLSCKSPHQNYRRIRRSFSVQVILYFFLLTLVMADRFESHIDGHHSPQLWFLMSPTEHWKGYTGILLRDYMGLCALVTLILAGMEAVWLFDKRRHQQLPKRIWRLQLITLGIAAILALYYGFIPRLDL